MTAENPQNVYACINLHNTVCPVQIIKQSVCINEDIGKVISLLANNKEKSELHDAS